MDVQSSGIYNTSQRILLFRTPPYDNILLFKRGQYMAIQESGEMYLETIYVLSKGSDCVRAIDVGEAMGFSKPSVSRAMGILREDGCIEVDPKTGAISLTEKGTEIASTIYDRHTILTKTLMMLGVEEAIAAEDACKIEHYISDRSIEAIKAYVESLEA